MDRWPCRNLDPEADFWSGFRSGELVASGYKADDNLSIGLHSVANQICIIIFEGH